MGKAGAGHGRHHDRVEGFGRGRPLQGERCDAALGCRHVLVRELAAVADEGAEAVGEVLGLLEHALAVHAPHLALAQGQDRAPHACQVPAPQVHGHELRADGAQRRNAPVVGGHHVGGHGEVVQADGIPDGQRGAGLARRCERHGEGHAARRIVAGDGAEHRREIRRGAHQRADVIEARMHRHHAADADEPRGGLQPRRAAERRGDAHRADRVRAERDRAVPGRDGGGRAAARAAGGMAGAMRVLGGAVPGIHALGAERSLVHVGGADQHRTGRAQPRDRERIGRGELRRTEAQPGRMRPSLDGDVRLDAGRQAVERTERGTAGATPVRGHGRRARAGRVDERPGAERGVVAGEGGEAVLEQLARAEIAALQRRGSGRRVEQAGRGGGGGAIGTHRGILARLGRGLSRRPSGARRSA